MTNVLLSRITQNWRAGLTVALVSIPLSISLAIASGAAPMAGIITAVWAGLVASLFGGNNYNVVGPAGALSGILAAYSLLHGAETLPLIAILAGGLILVAWAFRLERFLVFVPGSTIHGFTLSVAIIIGLNQLNAALGLTGLEKHEQFILNVWESISHAGAASLPATLTFAACLALLFILLKLTPKIPGAIILAPLGILLGFATTNNWLPVSLATIGSTFPNLSATLVALPSFGFNQTIVLTALTVAFVAILETMLSAKIADGMTKTVSNERKEMLGLGLANIAAGAAGGLPATGVLVRTALNIKSGATHKAAAGINAIVVGVISLLLFTWFQYLPMATIAAILVFASIRMVEQEHFIRFWKYDKTSFGLAMIVTLVSLYKDPTIGLGVGIAASLLLFMEKISRGQFEMAVNDKTSGILQTIQGEQLKQYEERDAADHILVYSMKGQLAYINSQAHISRFRSGLENCQWVVLRLRELYFIDVDGVDALADIIDLIHESGKRVAISGVTSFISHGLRGLKNFRKLEDEGLVFAKTSDALNYIRSQAKK